MQKDLDKLKQILLSDHIKIIKQILNLLHQILIKRRKKNRVVDLARGREAIESFNR